MLKSRPLRSWVASLPESTETTHCIFAKNPDNNGFDMLWTDNSNPIFIGADKNYKKQGLSTFVRIKHLTNAALRFQASRTTRADPTPCATLVILSYDVYIDKGAAEIQICVSTDKAFSKDGILLARNFFCKKLTPLTAADKLTYNLGTNKIAGNLPPKLSQAFLKKAYILLSHQSIENNAGTVLNSAGTEQTRSNVLNTNQFGFFYSHASHKFTKMYNVLGDQHMFTSTTLTYSPKDQTAHVFSQQKTTDKGDDSMIIATRNTPTYNTFLDIVHSVTSTLSSNLKMLTASALEETARQAIQENMLAALSDHWDKVFSATPGQRTAAGSQFALIKRGAPAEPTVSRPTLFIQESVPATTTTRADPSLKPSYQTQYVAGSIIEARAEGGYANIAHNTLRSKPETLTTSGLLVQPPDANDYSYTLEHGELTVPSKYATRFSGTPRPSFELFFEPVLGAMQNGGVEAQPTTLLASSNSIVSAMHWDKSERFKAYVKMESQRVKRNRRDWDNYETDGPDSYQDSTRNPICPMVAYNITSSVHDAMDIVELASFLLVCRDCSQKLHQITFRNASTGGHIVPNTDTFNEIVSSWGGVENGERYLPWVVSNFKTKSDPDSVQSNDGVTLTQRLEGVTEINFVLKNTITDSVRYMSTNNALSPFQTLYTMAFPTPENNWREPIPEQPIDMSLFGTTFGKPYLFNAKNNHVLYYSPPAKKNTDPGTANNFKTYRLKQVSQKITIPDYPAYVGYSGNPLVTKQIESSQTFKLVRAKNDKLQKATYTRAGTQHVYTAQKTTVVERCNVSNEVNNGTTQFFTLQPQIDFKTIPPNWPSKVELETLNANMDPITVLEVYKTNKRVTIRCKATVRNTFRGIRSGTRFNLSGTLYFRSDAPDDIWYGITDPARWNSFEDANIDCGVNTFGFLWSPRAAISSGNNISAFLSEIAEPDAIKKDHIDEATEIKDCIIKHQLDQWTHLPEMGLKFLLSTESQLSNVLKFIHTFGTTLVNQTSFTDDEFNNCVNIALRVKENACSFLYTDALPPRVNKPTFYLQTDNTADQRSPVEFLPADRHQGHLFKSAGAPIRTKAVHVSAGIHYKQFGNNCASYANADRVYFGQSVDFEDPSDSALTSLQNGHALNYVKSTTCEHAQRESKPVRDFLAPDISKYHTKYTKTYRHNVLDAHGTQVIHPATGLPIEEMRTMSHNAINMRLAGKDLFGAASALPPLITELLHEAQKKAITIYGEELASEFTAEISTHIDDVSRVSYLLSTCNQFWEESTYGEYHEIKDITNGAAANDQKAAKGFTIRKLSCASSDANSNSAANYSFDKFYLVLSCALKLAHCYKEAAILVMEPPNLPHFLTASPSPQLAHNQIGNAHLCDFYTMPYVLKVAAARDSIYNNILLDPTPRVSMQTGDIRDQELCLTWQTQLLLHLESLQQFSTSCDAWLGMCASKIAPVQNVAYYNDKGNFISGTPVPGGVFLNAEGHICHHDTSLKITDNIISVTKDLIQTYPAEAELSKTLVATVASAYQVPRRTLLQQIPKLMQCFANKEFPETKTSNQLFCQSVKHFFGELIKPPSLVTTPAQRQLKNTLLCPNLELDRFVFKLADPTAKQCKLPGQVQFDLNPDLWHIGATPAPFLEASLLVLFLLNQFLLL